MADLVLSNVDSSVVVGGKTALVVGIGAFESSQITPLSLAAADAVSIAEVLSLPPYSYEVETLIDGQATGDAVARALFEAKMSPAREFLFYFAGHGVQHALGTSLVFHDSAPYRPGMGLSELMNSFLPIESSNCFVILDCCYAGDVRAGGIGVSEIDEDQLERGIRTSPPSVAVIAACLGSEKAREIKDLGHGLLTHHLLEGLNGAAADDVGRVTPSSLFSYVSSAFSARGNQTPTFGGITNAAHCLASGFPCLSGRQTPPDELAEACRQAEEVLDQYLLRKRPATRTERLQRVFLEECNALEEVIHWFEKTEKKYPDIRYHGDYIPVQRSVRSEQAALCNLQEGMTIPGGRVRKPLGSGGFGSVWLVDNEVGGGVRAFKAYHSNELGDLDKVGRFRTGFRANKQLHHPNIVRVGEERTVPLGFYMEAIDGTNLREAGAENWLIEDRLSFLQQVAETLQYAHQNLVIHRDIKPENVLTRWNESTGRYEPVLTDFDLAWFTTATQRTQAAMGMAHYTPPEQRDFSNAGAVRLPTVDIFSFAQLLFFVCSGIDPTVNQVERNAMDLQKRIEDDMPTLATAKVLKIYRSCSEYSPAERMQEFSGVLDLMRDAAREIRNSQGNTDLSVERFLMELVHEVTGEVLDSEPNRKDLALTSRSRRIVITFDKLTERTVDDREGLKMTLRFTANDFGRQGVKNADARHSLNGQIDRALGNASIVARRRSGKSGSFEVYVDIDPIPCAQGQVENVADVCFRVIRAIESI